MEARKGAVLKQYSAGISASLSAFIVGCWIGWSSSAIKRIVAGETDLEITSAQISWIVALLDFGNIISPIPSGSLSDSLGRKNTLLLAAILYAGTWALALFGTAAWHLFVARVVAGVCKGIVFTVSPMYLGEIAEERVRGAVSAILSFQVHLGILFEYCVGPFVSYKMLNLISGTVPIIFFLTFCLLPESPYYFLMKSRPKEARKSLAWFRNTKLNDDSTTTELTNMQKNVQKELNERGRFLDLLATNKNRRAMVIVSVLSASQRIGGISPLLVYTVITLPATGGYLSADKYMIIFGVVLVVGSAIGILLIDSLGRKPLLIFSFVGCALFTGISAVFYWRSGPSNDLGALNWIPYFCFVMVGVTYSVGIGIIPSVFVGELFPTNIKSVASSVSAIVLAVSSFFIHKFYFFVKENYGTHCIFGFFTLINILSLIFTIFIVIETKNKTFSEIQDELSKGSQSHMQKNEKEICLP